MNLLDLLFPRRCVGCGKVGKYFCSKCFSKIQFIEQQICPVCARPAAFGITHPRCMSTYMPDGFFAAVHYTGPIKSAVHILKYRYVHDLIISLVEIFISKYPDTLPAFDFLVPVPLHPTRQKERGFNQSELLAVQIGKKLNITVENDVIKRIRNTTPQFKLKKDKRKKNTLGAFSLTNKVEISSKSIALVDDVATTVSTLSECAKVLKRNSAKTVWGIVLAHG